MKNKLTKEKQFYNDIKRAFKKIGIKVDEIYFKREIIRKTYIINFPETKDVIVGDNIFLECINVESIQYPENPKDYKSNDSILPCVLAGENKPTINPLKPAPQAGKKNRKKSQHTY